MSHEVTACITNYTFNKSISKNDNASLASKALSGWMPKFPIVKCGYDGFDGIELKALIEAVGTQGYSFCNPLNGNRTDQNFIHTNILVIDIDNKEGDNFITLADFLAIEFNKTYLAGYYTSRSHTERYNRFRAFYVTKSLIVGRDTFHSVIKGLATKLPRKEIGPAPKYETSMIDSNAIDACRLWFGSYVDPDNGSLDYYPNAEPLSDELIAELKKIGELESLKPKVHAEIRNGVRVNVINNTTVDADFVYYDANNQPFTMRDVYNDRKKRTLCCPYHHEKNPSAWVSYFEPTDNVYFNCSGCTEKRRMKSGKNVNVTESTSNILVLNDKFIYDNLQALDLMKRLGLITMKSHKGSGKTELLAQFVAWCKEQSLSVLVVGHRCSLLSNIANRLGLQYYKDEQNQLLQPTPYYAITFHSLPKISRFLKYDIVIIDESEQVFLDMAGKLHVEHRLERFGALKHWLNNSRGVILADADLSLDVSIKSLSTFVPTDKWSAARIINNYQGGGDVYILPSTGQAVASILNDVGASLKCFVASDNATFTQQLRIILETMDVNTRVLQVMNSERYSKTDSMSSDASSFIKDPTSFVGAYDIIIASPAMSTGVSITEECDNVYGIFQGYASQYFNVDQAIHRVRNIKGKVHVVIERSSYKDPKDQEEALAELRMVRRHVIGDSLDDHIKEFVEREELEGLLAHLFTLENEFNSNQKDQFIEYKQDQGCTIVLVDEDKIAAKLGRELLKESRALVENAEATKVWGAAKISLLEARALADKKKKSEEERFSLARFTISDALKINQDDLTFSQVENFLKHKLAVKVRNLREHAGPESHRLWHDVARSQVRPVQDVRMSTVQVKLRNEIYELLGVNLDKLKWTIKLDDLPFADAYSIKESDLENFGRYMEQNSDLIFSAFRRRCKRVIRVKNKAGAWEDLSLEKQAQRWKQAVTRSAAAFFRDVGLVLESDHGRSYWLNLQASRLFWTANRHDSLTASLKDVIKDKR